jgi:hypothetical protein
MSPTVQPMIALAQKTGSDPMKDYAVLKVLHGLVQHERTANQPTAILALAAADFRNVQAGETLYIVGHGYGGDGNINDDRVRPEQLQTKFARINRRIAGVIVLTCYGGQTYPPAGALVDKIKDWISFAGIPVTGMVGFSYGSPDTQETGLNSVLPSALPEAYKGTDFAALKTELGNMTVHTASYSELWQKYLEPGRTLASQIIR